MLQLKGTVWPMDKKNQDHLYAAYKSLTSDLKTYRVKVKGMEEYLQCKSKQKNKTKLGQQYLDNRR